MFHTYGYDHLLGLHKSSLQATIDHQGPSMYSTHYITSINIKTSYYNDNNIRMNDTKGFTAYVVMYDSIT